MGFGYIPTRRKTDSFSVFTSPRNLEDFGAKGWCPLAKVFPNKDSAFITECSLDRAEITSQT